MTLERFTKEERALTEIFIREIGETADAKIKNNGTPRSLRRHVHAFWRDNLFPILFDRR